jgi:hypothetical protein|tara:strand:- start:325 stop:432 length:108 start_codon:yes stop_codon:yes gene_type:complete
MQIHAVDAERAIGKFHIDNGCCQEMCHDTGWLIPN